MNSTVIATNYLKHLQNGEIDQVLALFHEEAVVDSPIYGTKKAREFYRQLSEDTSDSELHLKGLFESIGANSFALYFTYVWTP